MAVSLVLTTAIVGGVGWLAVSSEPKHFASPSQALLPTVESVTRPAPSSVASPVESSPLPNADPVPNAAAAIPGSIVKCVINGRTIYADSPCPNGTAAQPLHLHDSAGVVPAEARVVPKQQSQPAPQPRVASIGAPAALHPHAYECEVLSRRIDLLDAAGRQPQTAQSLERIRIERQKARDQQFALRC